MIRAVLIDLSGTIHIDNQIIPGAIEALNNLRKTDLFIKFVTNTTKESQNYLYNRLKNLGFSIEKDEIFSSLSAARQLIVKEKLKPFLLLASDAMEDFEDLKIKEGEKPDAVVIGLAPEQFHYERLTEAFRYLINGAKLIAIHEAKYYSRKDGLALGPGCFTRGLEYSAGCKAEIVGKPNKTFFLSAIGDINPSEVVMIGDDAHDDIAGAIKAGMKGYLVKTGKYRENDENKYQPKPTEVCKDISEAVEMILKNMGTKPCEPPICSK